MRARRGTSVLAKAQWDVLDPDILRWMAAGPPDEEFLIALLEARTILEPAAARLAAQRASAAQILEIERAFRGMADWVVRDFDRCCQHDLVFHEAILRASGNILLSRLAVAIRAALLSIIRTATNVRKSYQEFAGRPLAGRRRHSRARAGGSRTSDARFARRNCARPQAGLRTAFRTAGAKAPGPRDAPGRAGD